jgi:hypothetical protein
MTLTVVKTECFDDEYNEVEEHGEDAEEEVPFRTPVHMLQALKQFLTEMYSKSYIRKSINPYSSPVLVIPKPRNADGSSRGFRLVTDFRAINECVEPR